MSDQAKAVYPTEERIEGPTPSGGDYAIIYYRNVAGDPTPKNRATQVEIVEFKGENSIFHTFGTLKG